MYSSDILNEEQVVLARLDGVCNETSQVLEALMCMDDMFSDTTYDVNTTAQYEIAKLPLNATAINVIDLDIPAGIYDEHDLEGIGSRIAGGISKGFKFVFEAMRALAAQLSAIAVKLYNFVTGRNTDEEKEVVELKEAVSDAEKTIRDYGLSEGEKVDKDVIERADEQNILLPVDSNGNVVGVSKLKRSIVPALLGYAKVESSMGNLYATIGQGIGGDYDYQNLEKQMDDTSNYIGSIANVQVPQVVTQILNDALNAKTADDIVKLSMRLADITKSVQDEYGSVYGLRSVRDGASRGIKQVSPLLSSNMQIVVTWRHLSGMPIPVVSYQAVPGGKVTAKTPPAISLESFSKYVGNIQTMRTTGVKCGKVSAEFSDYLFKVGGNKGEIFDKQVGQLKLMAKELKDIEPAINKVIGILTKSKEIFQAYYRIYAVANKVTVKLDTGHSAFYDIARRACHHYINPKAKMRPVGWKPKK